ncbi:Redoxin [Podospora australis]|uniref:Redoxin n=1 Tax=Podospora australis TaxID=1536484 RepID=A0AAN7AN27_9PEZI|nr:Redoxin [Podospora australis]
MSAFRTLRPLARAAAPLRVSAATRTFTTTRPAFVKVGDTLPDLEVLQEGSPGTKVNLNKEATKYNNMILIGVPAAFSPSCSAQHVPGFIKHPKTKDFDAVAVVSVNDVFVMKAWGEQLDPSGDASAMEPGASKFRWFADPSGRFTKALDLLWDGSAIFGNERSKRYTIIVEGGKVKSINVEPDNTGTSVSLAEHVLGPATSA